MLPVIVYEPGTKLPRHGDYFLVTANGTFLRKQGGLISATIPVDGLHHLKSVKIGARHHFPRIPREVFSLALHFFRQVEITYNSEAVVLLHYNEATKHYALTCPKQKVTADEAKYDCTERIDDYLLVGTIHSHSSMDAFHSGTDDDDERFFDGIHITVGHLDRPAFDLSCSLMVHGTRFKLPATHIIEGISHVTHTFDLPEWQQLQHRLKQQPTSVVRRIGFRHDIDPSAETIATIGEWMTRVTRREFDQAGLFYFDAFREGDLLGLEPYEEINPYHRRRLRRDRQLSTPKSTALPGTFPGKRRQNRDHLDRR